MATDVAQSDDSRALRIEICRRTQWIDTPARALPRHQRLQRFDHRRARADARVVAHQPDADGVLVEMQRMRALNVLQTALAGVRNTARVRLRPSPFVDPAERVDEPV